MAEPVNENLCAERMKVQDERFARDLERIKALGGCLLTLLVQNMIQK